MLTFVINLDSSVDRFQNIRKQLNELGISFERISAVDGRKLSQEVVANLTYPLTHVDSKVRFTRELTKGEVGCFLSHKLCWEKLLESTDKWALIFEDDIQISPYAAKYLSNDAWLPNDVKLCQLNSPKLFQNGRIGYERKKIDKDVTLIQPIYPTPVGAFAYFISREAATKAIELSDKFPAPVDDFLFSPWFDLSKQFRIWRASPSFAIPIQGVTSNIGDRSKKAVKKAPFYIRHGLSRVLLDRKIKKLQAQGEEFVFRFWSVD